MNIKQILDFTPQIVSVKYGKEPSLREIMIEYYIEHMCSQEEAINIADKYIKSIEDEFK